MARKSGIITTTTKKKKVTRKVASSAVVSPASRLRKKASTASAVSNGETPGGHGGHSLEGRRKSARPLDENKPTHIVLTSSEARGRLAFSLPVNRAAIEDILAERAPQFGVRVSLIEPHGKNLHLILTFKDRAKFQGFLRTITSLLARKITGARKGHPFGRKFWDHIAYTRTVVNAATAVSEFETASKKSRT